MPIVDVAIVIRGQDIAGAQLILLLAIVALLCVALYDLFPRWR